MAGQALDKLAIAVMKQVTAVLMVALNTPLTLVL
jgi:hypothetical protein